jgi:coenzyme F420-reducing hydrogenase beta subunit
MVHKTKEECCGCGTCSLLCPVKAISMVEDSEGFKYPYINKTQCNNCSVCIGVCRFSKFGVNQNEKQEIYAVRHMDTNELGSSQSGGAFSAIVNQVLLSNGVVYGVVLENLKVIHRRSDNKKDCEAFKGSKYVQSDLGSVYSQVKADLKRGRQVLFSGTPCQVDGLSSYLKGDVTDNLILCDLICHGVPSPLIWENYTKYLEGRYKAKIKSFTFRDKSYGGWDNPYESIMFFNRKTKIIRDTYRELFYGNLILRPSCGVCKYSSFSRCSDISIGDFWGWEKSLPHEFNSDNRGVSLVLLNTKKGIQMFEAFKGNLQYEKVNEKSCAQRNLYTPTVHSSKRKYFWKIHARFGFLITVQFFKLLLFFKKVYRVFC